MRCAALVIVATLVFGLITPISSAPNPRLSLILAASDARFAEMFQTFASLHGVGVKVILSDPSSVKTPAYLIATVRTIREGSVDGWLTTTAQIAGAIRLGIDVRNMAVQTYGPHFRAHLVARDPEPKQCGARPVADIKCLMHRGLIIHTATGESSYMAGILTTALPDLNANCVTGAECPAVPPEDASGDFIEFLAHPPKDSGPRMVVFAAKENNERYRDPTVVSVAGLPDVFMVSLASVTNQMSPLVADAIPPGTYRSGDPEVATVADLAVTVSTLKPTEQARAAFVRLAAALEGPNPMLPSVEARAKGRHLLTLFFDQFQKTMNVVPAPWLKF